ncbi:MAG: diguanylate cyclase, partial [Tumebacillaceae bacterium]
DTRARVIKGGAHFHTILSVPLVSRDNVVGVITCYGLRTFAFNQEAIDLISVLAAHVGVVIENATLYRELQEATLRDPGTGLYNYRHFYQELGRRFKLAKEEQRPLSIVVIDIDHFKKYNDTYGHVVGDEVLRQTGQVVQQTVGDRGVVARYGGEEFAAILDVALEEAKPLVEQIRRAVAHNCFEYQGYVVQGVTISAGVATYPDHDQDEKELLEKADQAMYWGAKQRGRNKVALYTPDFDAHLFVDQLTGLYTYHYLHIKMMEEFTLAPGQHFGLIFLNIVEFDKINRLYGFEVGNHVLRELSMLIKQNVRNGEIASRYGGDEFLLLVPGVDRSEAEKICERLVKAIAQHPFRIGDHVLIRVQTRYDMIIYPEEVDEEHQLISIIPQTFLHLSSEWIETHTQTVDA